jgi:hypothetical protein
VWPGHDADHSPHLVPRSRMSRSYTSSPPQNLRGIAGQLYFIFFLLLYVIHEIYLEFVDFNVCNSF